MAKASKTFCLHCEKRIEAGVAFCPHCERPTPWATHEQRVDWEVAQWRGSRGGKAAAKEAPPVTRRRARAPEPVVEAPAAAVAVEAPPVTPEPVAAREVAKVVAAPRTKVARKPAPKQVARVRAVAVPHVESTNGSTNGSASIVEVPPAAAEVPTPAPAKAPVRQTLRAVAADEKPQAKKRSTTRTKPVLKRPKVDPSEYVLESEPIAPPAPRKGAAPKKAAPAKPGATKAVKATAKPKPVARLEPERTIDIREKNPTTEQLLEQAVELLLQMNERLAAVEKKLFSMNGSRPHPVEPAEVLPETKRRFRLRKR